ncbi:MAG: hypothetical protein M1826_000407 [Phylliscum demangeonii]|nr:MAG: hypothetical protein M1826_000407 [Phylliscum demangeonii]
MLRLALYTLDFDPSTGTSTAAADNPTGGLPEASHNPFPNQRMSSDDNNLPDAKEDAAAAANAADQPIFLADRRLSKECDAAKVPLSRFQKREGSIYATPSSRDGHVEKNTQTAYTEKLKEKGWH